MNEAAVVMARDVCKRFPAARGGRETVALDGISLDAPAGALTALVGPDGAGKTTLLRLVAGLMKPEGSLRVLDVDVAADPQAVQNRISYMPQRFGLYEDLSVQENLDLYADLHGVSREQRRGRYARLLEMTDLGRFTARPAGKLSGGMKQKLGLACTLVRSPELLLLDEPTVGVDPLSRRELWQIVQQLVDDERLSVIVSTTYLDEAERCARVFVLHEGRLLAQGRPEDIRRPARGLCFVAAPPPGEPARLLQARLLDDTARIIDAVPQGGEVRVIRREAERGAPAQQPGDVLAWRPVEARLEDGFMVLLRERQPEAGTAAPLPAPRAQAAGGEAIIEVRDLVRKFGDFVAVDRTSFTVKKGEIFGLLGPNGAGKTTTFRMLCGLLPASSGFLRVAGVDLRTAPARARRSVGYVSQRFALYGNLSVMENLTFFGSAYGLHGERLRARIGAVLAQFGLQDQSDAASGRLPGGYKQRLAMAVALLHEPDILFLDEPTSGADALARREFWRRITALAADGTTVVVTTHFMEEAEYCDRIVIQDAGRLLALGTPQQVRRQAGETDARRMNMEETFIGIVERGRKRETAEAAA
ncbi:ABC transporter ATP-binding protein [Pigmentiphaga sp. H8]|uniref:ATP-binding cassette domain-containing protein n=1 Tax=Pigmentiphaga sp. H8 TaxID=2488560 RepID=UPI000F593C30|nr:ATP-binding cassette domain-containing protein [Pigmentiphaga sp. H8]AZG07763.1 ABC transporter ATP-binding protein [Pigmentiphaga sp. H8]